MPAALGADDMLPFLLDIRRETLFTKNIIRLATIPFKMTYLATIYRQQPASRLCPGEVVMQYEIMVRAG